MEYKSYSVQVKAKMKLCKHEFCEAVGVWAVGEVKSIAPINQDKHAPTRGNLKKSIASEVMPGDEGVYIGVTPEAKYGIYVEKGTSKQKAQPFLEPGILNTLPHIQNIAYKHYEKMGGE